MYIYLWSFYDLHCTRNIKKIKRWCIYTHGIASYKIFWHKCTWRYNERLFKWHWCIEKYDGRKFITGNIFNHYNYKRAYFNVYPKCSIDILCSSNDYNYDCHNKDYFCKKFKELYCTAKKYRYCKWICRGNDRRPESRKSIFVWEKSWWTF